jgi:hypothetical protein
MSEVKSLLKYAALIALSAESKAAEERDFINQESEQQLQSDILATRKDLSAKKRAVVSAKSAIPFNSQNIVTAQKAVEKAEEALGMLLSLQKELF